MKPMRALLLVLWLSAPACVSGCIPMGWAISSSSERSFRFIGAAELNPADAASQPRQALAAQFLAGRWSSFDLYWRVTYGHGNLRLASGSYYSTQASQQDGFMGFGEYPSPDAVLDQFTRSVGSAEWVIRVPDTDSGVTGLELHGAFDANSADAIIKHLHKLKAGPGFEPTVRSDEPLTVHWHMVGTADGAPFAADFDQVFYAERIDYSTPI